MNLTAYNALFRDLAARHKAVLATPDNGRFLRVLISTDFVQKQLDLSEFYSKLKSGLKARGNQPFLVVENYQTDYIDQEADYYRRQVHAAYLVLQYVRLDDYDGRDEAISACEQIAEELLGALAYRLRDEHQAYLTLADAWSEHVGPVGEGHVGVRVNLTWKEPATEELLYDETKFN